jgi:hypothetical protein
MIARYSTSMKVALSSFAVEIVYLFAQTKTAAFA